MYTSEDYQKTKRAFCRILIVDALVILIFSGFVVFSVMYRIRWLALVASAVGFCLLYTLLVLKTKPWYHYRKFLSDMATGRTRETVARFVSISENTRVSDGVAAYDFVATTGDTPDDEMLFYWDADKPRPTIQAGQSVRIRSFGRFIKELTIV